ncbi:hypothetical protein BAZMOX_97609_0 [methanotrophic endosymbiont of Bathymodiolus azoricus (Menez Gwen)]|nr:hypothetical protein BAZMOX_97609_0 [methanotrophic endosymbiont of Bathymodiolus azoricus (Menez Gwen)]
MRPKYNVIFHFGEGIGIRRAILPDETLWTPVANAENQGNGALAK